MMLGYKGFDADMTCRGFQYEVGQTYEHDGNIGLCEAGFHFCRNMTDVFEYYPGKGCRYAVVEALGKVVDGEDKSVTNRLRIIRELSWTDVLKEMAVCEGLDPVDSPFPADEIIKAREAGTLGEILPSVTEFPVRFSNGERNVLVVGRDASHTYLVTKYLMAERFAMNDDWTNKGGWPASDMRQHVQRIYDMLPEDIRKVVVPMHIKQYARRKVVECDDMAFLLSTVNVFGKDAWDPKTDCRDSRIDIFCEPAGRVKRRVGASSASWWWLRSADSSTTFLYVGSDGSYGSRNAGTEGGVVVGFCIEDRGIGAAS